MKQVQRQKIVAQVMDLLDQVEREPDVVHSIRISARKGRPSGTMESHKTIIEIEDEHHREFKDIAE